jgi:hypothetical protein
MDSNAVENAFDVYFRGENPTTRAVSGLGLGLSIAKTIVNMHQGEIFLSSAPNNGTRIGFELPRIVQPLNVDFPAWYLVRTHSHSHALLCGRILPASRPERILIGLT